MIRSVPTRRQSRPDSVRGFLTDRFRSVVTRLGRDEIGVTSLEYLVAALAIALAAIAASRTLAEVLIGYLQRVYLVVTLPIP